MWVKQYKINDELKFGVNLAHFKQADAHVLKVLGKRASNVTKGRREKLPERVSLLQAELWCKGMLNKEQAGELY